MTTLDFLNEIFFELSKKEQKIILQHAQKAGLIVEGFEKSPWRAPKSRIKNFFTLESRRKNICHREFVLNAIRELPGDNDISKQLIAYAKKWNFPDDSLDAEIEIKTILESKVVEEKSEESILVCNDIKVVQLQKKLKRCQEKLEMELYSKNRKLEQMKDKLKSEETQCQKIREEKKKEINMMNDKLKILQEENGKLINVNAEQLKRIKELETFRPKILCFGNSTRKDCIEHLTEKFNITLRSEWDKNNTGSIHDKSFDAIWFIYSDFQYSSFVEIKEFFKNTKITDFLSWDSLMERMA